jgi:hypothetical protein
MACGDIGATRREPGWVGRDERTQVRLDGCARRADNSVVSVAIHDLSREGCRVEPADTMFNIGEWLNLDVAGLQSFRAQVRWVQLGSAGVQFAE